MIRCSEQKININRKIQNEIANIQLISTHYLSRLHTSKPKTKDRNTQQLYASI